MRFLHRLGAVLWLAVQPLGWTRKAVSVITAIIQVAVLLGFISGTLSGHLPVPLPEQMGWRVAIVLAVLLALMIGAAYQLKRIADRAPHLIVTRSPYTALFSSRTASAPPTWSMRVEVANDPLDISPDAEAKRVWVRLSAWNEERVQQFPITASAGGEVFGRWIVPTEKGGGPPTGWDDIHNAEHAIDWVDIPPNGERFTIEFAERRQPDSICYIASHVGEFNMNHAIPEQRFWVRLRLRGTNCEEEFWIKVDSNGTDRPECTLA